MMTETLNKRINQHRHHGLLRERNTVDSRNGNHVIMNGKLLINFCNNDYLGLATHPTVKRAFIKGVKAFGLGSSASAIVSGSYKPHRLLEEKFAEFLNRDQAVLFNSGYHANLGVITSLANRHSTILSDKLCHASILDAISLSRAKHLRFQHNNVSHCESLLQTTSQPALVVTESVYSIEGDISPLNKLSEITQKYLSTLIVDDAHGIGVLGKKGGGICEHYNLSQDIVPCLITPLGKALGGMGAIVTGSETLIKSLIQFSRTFYYSTALPPAVAAAMIESLTLLQKETWRLERLRYLTQYFINQALLRSLPLISTHLTPIKSFLVGDNQLALGLKNTLIDHGFLVSCLRPPTVQLGKAQIRVALNCLQTEHEIDELLDIMAKFYENKS